MIHPISSSAPVNFLSVAAQKTSEIFNIFEKKVWKVIKETGNITKFSAKIAVSKACDLGGKLPRVIAGVGLLAGISILLELKYIPSHIQSLVSNLKIHDHEGIAVSLLSIVSTPLNLLDYSGTFANSLADLVTAIPKLGFFALIGLPLSLGLLTYSALRSAYEVIRCAVHLHNSPNKVTEENLDSIKAYLHRKLEVTEEEKAKIERKCQAKKNLSSEKMQSLVNKKVTRLKCRKHNILARHTDMKVLNIMKNLQEHLSQRKDLDTANDAIKDMRTLMRRKIVVGSLASLAYSAFTTSLVVASILGVAPPLVVSIAGMGKATTMLGNHLYKQAFMGKGLRVPKFAKSP